MFEWFLLFSFILLSAYGQETPDYDNPYAPIFMDKEVYSWTDKVRITIVAPSWNANQNGIDSIGTQEGHFIKISTRSDYLEPYKLVETNPDSGVFTGEVILTGFLHDVDGDGEFDTMPQTSGNGPTNGFLSTERDDGITLSFEFADGVTLTNSALVSWNVGQVSFTLDNFLVGSPATVTILDPDMNLKSENLDQVSVTLTSDSDLAGITVNAIETGIGTGMFEATIFFTQDSASSGNKLFAVVDDSLYAKYDDYTLPAPYSVQDKLEINAESKLISEIPLVDRITISEINIADSRGNTIAPVINSPLQVVGKVTNNLNSAQDFIYLIQIKDVDDTVVSLSWIQGSLSPNQVLGLSQSWTASTTGFYQIEVYVWRSIIDPTPLALHSSQTLFVQ